MATSDKKRAHRLVVDVTFHDPMYAYEAKEYVKQRISTYKWEISSITIKNFNIVMARFKAKILRGNPTYGDGI